MTNTILRGRDHRNERLSQRWRRGEGRVIDSPCHGATYDPNSGAVTGGPATLGLARKKVMESGGQIYAVPS